MPTAWLRTPELSPRSRDHKLLPASVSYGIALGLVLIAFLSRLLLTHEIGAQNASMLFVPAVLIAGGIGGLGPGLAATALTAVLGIYPLDPFNDLTTPKLFEIGIYIVIGAGMSWVGERLLRSRADLIQTHNDILARESHLRSILETVPDAMIVIDSAGLIQSFSSAAQRLFGYTPEDIIGRNVRMLMPQPDRDRHDGYLAHYAKTGEKKVIGRGRTVIGARKDGTTFPMELSVGEMQFADKKYFTGFVRDLTERQKIEARLQELQSELVHISRLTAMGEMASTLAHELNQPLSAITNYINGSARLLEAPTAENLVTAKDGLGKAGEQAIRAGKIIRRLRDFVSRGESERHVESVAKLVEEANALALVGIDDQEIPITYHLDQGADLVIADRVQIEQVLINLVRNAIEAMAGTPKREVTISSVATPDGMTAISVADTGMGISSEQAAHLFTPFFTTKPQGMGVGLSICRTIVEAHGGRITVEPNAGGGTVFRFTLQRAQERSIKDNG